jgi:hypothetical protein
MSKRAAIELTLGTIVIIVLAVTMLILGIVFVKSIMCSGIIISDQLSVGVKNQIRSLFNADEYGVKCIGEGGSEVSFATGGKRQVVCIIKTEEQAKYKLTVKDIVNINGKTATQQNLAEKWLMGDATGEWDVSPGGDGTDAVVAVLNIPKDAPASYLKLTIDAENKDTGSKTTHTSYINIETAGFMRTTLC